MNTLFLLMAQCNDQAVVSLDVVCRDDFSHLTPVKFLRKVSRGEIETPLVRMETSQKAARGVHIQDLAEWIDTRRATAVLEARALAS